MCALKVMRWTITRPTNRKSNLSFWTLSRKNQVWLYARRISWRCRLRLCRDNMVRQLFTVAKTYRIVKSKVKAASKLTPSGDVNGLSHLPGNLKYLKNFDLKGSARVRGELRFTQTVQRCEEIIARFWLETANKYFTNANLEVELLYTPLNIQCGFRWDASKVYVVQM